MPSRRISSSDGWWTFNQIHLGFELRNFRDELAGPFVRRLCRTAKSLGGDLPVEIKRIGPGPRNGGTA